jgi:hypothetical protein
MPAITTSVDTLDNIIKSEVPEARTLQERSEVRVRDDLIDLKMHMIEVEALQRSIADRNQADSQALRQWQAELQNSVRAVQGYLRAQLDLLLRKDTEQSSSKELASNSTSTQMLLGIVQTVSSGIAGGIGAMVAISSQKPIARSDETRSHVTPQTVPPSWDTPLYDDVWDDAYRMAAGEYAKHDSSYSTTASYTKNSRMSSPNSLSSNTLITMGWGECHECKREINRALHGDGECPDCGHQKCDECMDPYRPHIL